MASGLITVTQAANTQPVELLTATWQQFNHYFFMYQMISAIELLIIAFLFWTFRPYISFVVSKIWTHLPVVGLMNRVRNTAPVGGFLLRNGMYRKEMKNTTMYFVKKYHGSFFFMGCPFDIVHIDRGFVQDPIMNKYVNSLIAQGYSRWRDVEDALYVNSINPEWEVTKLIAGGYNCANYKALQNFLNPYGLTTTAVLYAPKYSNIPQDALIDYGKNAPPGTIAAEIDHWFEFTKPDIEKDKIMEWLPYIAVIMVLGIVGYILAMAVQHAK